MISSTRTSEAQRSSAATPQHTSRSVTTPTSLRLAVSSTTGAQPQPEARIARAACAAVSWGVQHEDASIGVITSLQQLIVFASFGCGIAIQSTRRYAQQKINSPVTCCCRGRLLHKPSLASRCLSNDYHPITKATVTNNAPVSKYGAFMRQINSALPNSGPPA